MVCIQKNLSLVRKYHGYLKDIWTGFLSFPVWYSNCISDNLIEVVETKRKQI